MDSGRAWPCSGIGTRESRKRIPSGVERLFEVMGVMTVPGDTAFSAIPAPAHSSVGALRRTHLHTAALDDE